MRKLINELKKLHRSFFAAYDDFRQSFGRGQEMAEKRIIKLQSELSELEKAMWKESCIKSSS